MRIKCAFFILIVSLCKVSSQNLWRGDTSDFQFKNDTILLKAEPETSEKTIFMPSTVSVNGFWGCVVNMDFNPSSSNLCKLYLCADDTLISEIQNGLFMTFGSSDDDIKLYSITNGISTLLIDGENGRLNKSENTIYTRVVVSDQNELKLQIRESETAPYINVGQFSGYEPLQSAYFIIHCQFTATRSTLFSFSGTKIEGSPYTPKPSTYKTPQLFDLIINEVMANPSPIFPIAEEYIELYNRSDDTINLEDLSLKLNTYHVNLPKKIMPPGTYTALTKNLSKTETVLNVPNLPPLANSEIEIVLLNKKDSVVDMFNYSKNMHEEPFKRNEGWSLERVDFENVGDENNWGSCINNNGGTPGEINSIYASNPDISEPKIIAISPLDTNTLTIFFNEPLKHLEFSDTSLFLSILPKSNHSYFDIVHKLPLTYDPKTITINTIGDYNSNQTTANIEVGLPSIPAQNTIIINELLIEPEENQYEFIELFNASEKFLNSADLYLSTRNNDGQLEALLPFSAQPYLIPPKSYIVLSKTKLKDVDFKFPTQNFIIEKFRTLANDKGTVVISNKFGIAIDEVSYTSEWHNSGIKNTKGVSLERIFEEHNSNSASNWTSASLAQLSTPGRRNSQHMSDETFETEVLTLSSQYFTPNGDGDKDLASITINKTEEYSLTLQIYNSKGQLIHTLCNNYPSHTKSVFIWDGTKSNGASCSTGIYIVIANIQTKNESKLYRDVISLSR